MKIFIVLSCLVALGCAAPPILTATLKTYTAAPIAVALFPQDRIGQYETETKSLDRVTRGTYSYIGAEEKVQKFQYTADVNGFQVSASNLPVAPPAPVVPPVGPLEQPKPEDTPEVAKAKEEHFAAVKEAKA